MAEIEMRERPSAEPGGALWRHGFSVEEEPCGQREAGAESSSRGLVLNAKLLRLSSMVTLVAVFVTIGVASSGSRSISEEGLRSSPGASRDRRGFLQDLFGKVKFVAQSDQGKQLGSLGLEAVRAPVKKELSEQGMKRSGGLSFPDAARGPLKALSEQGKQLDGLIPKGVREPTKALPEMNKQLGALDSAEGALASTKALSETGNQLGAFNVQAVKMPAQALSAVGKLPGVFDAEEAKGPAKALSETGNQLGAFNVPAVKMPAQAPPELDKQLSALNAEVAHDPAKEHAERAKEQIVPLLRQAEQAKNAAAAAGMPGRVKGLVKGLFE